MDINLYFHIPGLKIFDILPNSFQTEKSLSRLKASSKDTNLDVEGYLYCNV